LERKCRRINKRLLFTVGVALGNRPYAFRAGYLATLYGWVFFMWVEFITRKVLSKKSVDPIPRISAVQSSSLTNRKKR
jgi:hypothetical protein